ESRDWRSPVWSGQEIHLHRFQAHESLEGFGVTRVRPDGTGSSAVHQATLGSSQRTVSSWSKPLTSNSYRASVRLFVSSISLVLCSLGPGTVGSCGRTHGRCSSRADVFGGKGRPPGRNKFLRYPCDSAIGYCAVAHCRWPFRRSKRWTGDGDG